jgi:putative Mg2+ transporter-C (MgtC) family protein
MLVSIWLPQQLSFMKNGDPGRIAAQVVSGIGFLGAGAIIRLGNNVKGLTTAASLWFTAAVGMAVGAGMFLAAAAAETLGMITLILLELLERRFFPLERNKLLYLDYKTAVPKAAEALEVLKSFGVRIQTMDADSAEKGRGSRLRLLVGLPASTDIEKLYQALKATGKADRIEMKEKY